MSEPEGSLTRIVKFLRENPKYREMLRLAIDHEEKNINNQNYLGWEWNDVRAYPAELTRLVKEGLIDIRYKSRRYTNYLLHERENVKRALKELDKEEVTRIFKQKEETTQ